MRRLDADISVTICQVMAPRRAERRDRGAAKTIDKCVYVRRCQNPDGGFMHMASGGAFGSAGVVALHRVEGRSLPGVST